MKSSKEVALPRARVATILRHHNSCSSLPCCIASLVVFYFRSVVLCKAPDGSICNSHGSCRNGACACRMGFQGDFCADSSPVDPGPNPGPGCGTGEDPLHVVLGTMQSSWVVVEGAKAASYPSVK